MLTLISGSPPSDPQGQMIVSLAQDSQVIAVTLEKAATVFEEQIAALHQQIGSLSMTNGKLHKSLIAAEGRVKEVEALCDAKIKAIEAKADLQTQTQKETCDKMLARCKEIALIQGLIQPAHFVQGIHWDLKSDSGLLMYCPTLRADYERCTEQITKTRKEYLAWTSTTEMNITNRLVGVLKLEIGLLEDDIKSLSGK